MKKTIINIIITLLIGTLMFYITLPAINLNNMGFYTFIAFIFIVFAVLQTINKDNLKLFSSKRKLQPLFSFPKEIIYIFSIFPKNNTLTSRSKHQK